MQPRLLTSLIVFFASYFPLSVILLVQNFDYSSVESSFCWPLKTGDCELPLRNPAWAIGMVVVAFICLLITMAALALIKPKQEIEIEDIKYVPTDLMNYTLPYIVSFMSIDYQDTGKFVGFSVFLAWMFWISHRSGQIVLNPLLISLSWRLYETSYRFAGSADTHSGRALVKGHLARGPFKQSLLQDIQIIKP